MIQLPSNVSNELRIHFPGSRQYGSVGAIENATEVGEATESDIVKVIGSKEACAKAAELLQVRF